ncbi:MULTISPECIES: DUF2637 domain-containing protein [unclassified Streptomyces]|uniref:Integral membrane protein n=1 Tax=Streptomyces sp. F12 TaxID=1436084 RepID=V9Z3W0_9ACTN|nr:DUF2637 domain-containing protein [Streptomyces sp. F12]AHE40175.1 Integral membrane protein [Streptomyces sp. F12]
MPASTSRIQLTRWHRVLIAIVVVGVAVVAAIGFVGSYTAVSDLARAKGFGAFAAWFPIGVDAAIVMLLALDLLLDWLGMQLLLLRYAAWFLSGATVAFNAAAALGDPVAMAMHATMPLSFLAAVEAARRAISRLAGLSEHRPMDSVRLARWFLAPRSTLLLWRRMKLWELTSYTTTITLEQERMLYRARLRSRFGWKWRSKAPVEARMPLKMARYGIPIRDSLTPATAHMLGLDPSTLLAADPAPPGGRVLEPTSAQTAPAPAEAAFVQQPPPPAVQQAMAGSQQPRNVAAPGADPEAARAQEEQARHKEPAAEQLTPTGEQQALQPDADDGREGPGFEQDEPGGSSAGHDGSGKEQATSPPFERDEDQATIVAGMRPADAIRHAITVLNTFDHAQIVEWLKLHGKKVNRGQAFRVAEAAERNSKQPDAETRRETETDPVQQAAA